MKELFKCTIGHSIQRNTFPCLDFELLSEIYYLTKLPLHFHTYGKSEFVNTLETFKCIAHIIQSNVETGYFLIGIYPKIPLNIINPYITGRPFSFLVAYAFEGKSLQLK